MNETQMQIVANCRAHIEKVTGYLKEGKGSIQNIANSLFQDHSVLAVKGLYAGDFQSAKNDFNICLMIDCFLVEKFNSRFLEYGVDRVCWAILSDNINLYQRYGHLRFEEAPIGPSMNVLLSYGQLTITPLMQFALVKDMKSLSEYLEKIIKGELSKKKNESLLLDAQYFSGLVERDKNKIESVLSEFVSPKLHKKRNNDPFFSEYISVPAVGYAKLAWINGIEVEVNSPLIPRELLPLKPNSDYVIPYDFLKDLPN